MVYYLGRDVKVYLTTEAPEAQINVSSNAVSAVSHGGSSVAATATFTFGDTEFDDDDEMGEEVELQAPVEDKFTNDLDPAEKK